MEQQGRPTDYTPAMDNVVRRAADEDKLGAATIKIIAKYLAVAPSSVYLWMAKHPSFSEAIAYARGLADQDVVVALHERSKGYTKKLTEQKVDKDGGVHDLTKEIHIPADTPAAIFWLKNRNPEEWADKTKVELTGDFVEQVEAMVRGQTTEGR
jgi:hypothetical protein